MTSIIIGIIAFVLGTGGTLVLLRVFNKRARLEAEAEAELLKKNKLIEAKEKFIALKAEHEQQVMQRNAKVQEKEVKLQQREMQLNQKQGEMQRKINEVEALRETHEQPEVLRRLLNEEEATAQALADLIQGRGIDHIVIAARGTSDNAGRYAQYVLGAMNGFSVGLAAPSLFSIYRRPPRFGNALVIGISQSGNSPDIVAVLAEARRQGALTAVLTNRTGSPLAEQGDVVIDLRAGEERAVAATKTFTAELAAVALISATLSGLPAGSVHC